ncbi:MAG: hypothetical protein LBT21_05235 [Oscillospiraceae bacterium]|jgi:hypothetical protein|nr:hypothetical protein [Oscillospiraceae bacterium]
MRTLRKCCLIAAVLLLLGGCSGWKLQPVETLMRPPAPFGEYAPLLKAFQKKAGVNAVLAIPTGGGTDRGAVRTFDADLDGEDDSALLVYSDGGTDKNLRYALYYLVDGDWRFLMDEAGEGKSYVWAKFADMPGYGSCQVLICWSTDTAYSLSILDYKDAKERAFHTPTVNPIGVIQGEAFSLVDLDADAKQELFYVKRESADGIVRSWGIAAVLAEDRLSIKPWAKIPLDGGASGYGETQVEHMPGGDRLFINAYKGAAVMFTELIQWDSGQQALADLTIDQQTLINISTLRPAGLLAQDVNGDGLFEIPVFVDVGDSEDAAVLENALQEIAWQQWNADGCEEVFPSILNMSAGYILRTDKEPLSFCSFVPGRGEGEFSFRLEGKEIFSLAENSENDSGIHLTNGNKTVTLTITSEGESRGITEGFIKRNLFWRL